MLVSDSSHENCRQHNSSGVTGMAWPSIPQKTTYSVAAVAGRWKVQEGVSNSAPLCELQSQTNVRRGSRRGRRANAAGGRSRSVCERARTCWLRRKNRIVLGLRANFWAFLIWFSIVTPFLRAHCETANALPLSAISDERTKVHQSWKLGAWLRKLHHHSFFRPI